MRALTVLLLAAGLAGPHPPTLPSRRSRWAEPIEVDADGLTPADRERLARAAAKRERKATMRVMRGR